MTVAHSRLVIDDMRWESFWCVRLTDASAAGASPAERKGSHHFHREPCAGHREVSGEASVAACTASLVTGLTGESPVGVILSLTP